MLSIRIQLLNYRTIKTYFISIICDTMKFYITNKIDMNQQAV